MAETLLGAAMLELGAAKAEIAAAHTALDELRAPGTFEKSLPERIQALRVSVPAAEEPRVRPPIRFQGEDA